jgi:transposase InsO family protein
VLDKILSTFGIPNEITSDNGPPYNSEAFGKYADYLGFEHTTKIPYAPWANGTAENFMKNQGKVTETATEAQLASRASKVPKSISSTPTSDDQESASSPTVQREKI